MQKKSISNFECNVTTDMKSNGWHALTVESLERELGSDSNNGLTEREAEHRLSTVGPNELPEAPPPSPLKILLAQFSSLIVWVLIGAAVVSGLLQEWIDAAAIVAIVVLNAILGFVQEFRAERSLAALRKLSVATARVIRVTPDEKGAKGFHVATQFLELGGDEQEMIIRHILHVQAERLRARKAVH